MIVMDNGIYHHWRVADARQTDIVAIAAGCGSPTAHGRLMKSERLVDNPFRRPGR
jgi:hypothetical protein